MIFGELHAVNPRLALPDWAWRMVRLWRAYQAGHLPEPGGLFDQPAAMLEAFAVMSGVEARLAREKRDGGG